MKSKSFSLIFLISIFVTLSSCNQQKVEEKLKRSISSVTSVANPSSLTPSQFVEREAYDIKVQEPSNLNLNAQDFSVLESEGVLTSEEKESLALFK